MTVRLVCRSCGKRLKIPDGLATNRTARCPKCSTPVDLTAARAYAPVPLLGSDDPLPYTAPTKTTAPTKPAPPPQPKPPPPKPIIPSLPTTPPLPTKAKGEAAPGPRPSPPKTPAAPSKDDTPNTKHQTATDEVLSLDDDQSDGPAEVEPFRVPVNVLADSLTAHVGSCVAVLLPHGLFLEHEPMKPFLFVPVGARVSSQAPGELTAILPDGRTVTMRFAVRYARPLARDARAFLAGEGPVPAAADYRRKWWMLWAAIMFALGLAGGPLVLSQTAQLGIEFGLKVGGGFALAGAVANGAVVLFSRRPVFVQLIVMAGVCVAVTGLFLFGATAYLAGRQRALEEARAEQQQQQPPPAPPPKPPEEKPPEPPPEAPPSHLDRARKNGSSALDDGPADVTALALAPDGRTLAVGHANGATKLWPLDQPTFDPPLPGPSADSAVTRIQFVADGRFVFAHTATGAVGVPRTAQPIAPAKLIGAPIAIAPALDGDRVRFAAVRGGQLVHRSVRDTFIQMPPPGAKGYSTPKPADEIAPTGAPKDGPKPPGANWPTFLAWGPGNRLLAGAPDGTISAWSAGPRPESSRDHRAPVKAWAMCPATGDFATGDDQGKLGVWSSKTGKPALPLADVLSTPITGVAFNSSGSRLAVIDTTGWLIIWDVAAAKSIHRVKRPVALKAVALGPGDDVLALAYGRTVEVWAIAELIK